MDERKGIVERESSNSKGHGIFRPIITIDQTLHEPARLAIVTLLSSIEDIDFRFLKEYIGLSQGNLSSHIRRLEKAGYVKVERAFVGRYPRMGVRLTKEGKRAYHEYRANIEGFLKEFQ
jgi:DNA-binding transcriptional ArsR family regulator